MDTACLTFLRESDIPIPYLDLLSLKQKNVIFYITIYYFQFLIYKIVGLIFTIKFHLSLYFLFSFRFFSDFTGHNSQDSKMRLYLNVESKSYKQKKKFIQKGFYLS